jgi:uncharacterized protein (DUF697 family)
MSVEFLIATLLGMVVQSLMNGIVNRDKVVSFTGSAIAAGLCVAWAIVIYALSLYW